MRQYVMGFFEGMLQESVVRRLLRFVPGRRLKSGEYVDGLLHEVSYRQWLSFYTPLCERGASL